MTPEIVFFDMDHTLIDNDCDVSWKEFLIELEVADPAENQEKELYFRQYLEGCLQIEPFLEFQFRQFRFKTPDEMRPLATRHFERHVLPRVYPDARRAVQSHREAGRTIAILTSTCDLIAEPLAAHLEIDQVMGTRLELRDGRYTGRIAPPYCHGAGKLEYARPCCERRGLSLQEAAYYGDSVNDVPMLEAVGCPVVVNPSEELASIAAKRDWPVERWRLDARPTTP